ncbi:MAG: hypothetical protein HFF18_12590 [Oscillospiraceae bacterium]|nr:hypothetical protein [Oscillospiraceae bacterium]
MTGTLWESNGGVYRLPELLEWELTYTAGAPCDSFSVRCVYDPDMDGHLHRAVEFTAESGGERMFYGVVDEYQITWDGNGRQVEVAGRGMAARLLDNEAEAQEYQTATLDDILDNHVRPYGITVGDRESLPPVPGFAVASGSSQWQVLYQFACYYGGVTPRFDRTGRLLLCGWKDGTRRVLDGRTPVLAIRKREKRYGVLSEILVRDKPQKRVESIRNRAFLSEGGSCSRVITMPGRSSYQDMRYSGEYQIRRSEAERNRVELTVAAPFWGWPGELAELRLERIGLTGEYRILEASTGTGGEGAWTRLTLGDPDALV